MICGTSMGALVGGFYLAGQMDALTDLVRTLTRFRMVRLLDFMVPDNGIIGGKRMFRELEKIAGDRRIEDLPTRFAAVASELHTGHEIWLTEGHMLDAIRASVSIPGIFKPIKVDGRWLIDGALVNPVPVSVCRSMGARVVIAVTLTGDTMSGIADTDERNPDADTGEAPYTGEERRNCTPERLGSAMRQLLAVEQEEPNFLGTMAASFTILLDRITRSRLAGDPPDVSITPRMGHIGLLDFHRAEDAIEEGAKAVDRIVPELMEVIGMLARRDSPDSGLDQAEAS
jgi:NTE family protein